MINITDIIIYTVFLLICAPWATRLSRTWLSSFHRWQYETRQYHIRQKELLSLLNEWQALATAIDRGEHPFTDLSDEMTLQLGKFAHQMIKHIQNKLTQLEQDYHGH